MTGIPLAPERRAKLLQIAIWVSLVLSVLIIYGQTVGFDYTNLDDPDYVSDNPHVKEGLTPASVMWAFTSQTVSNWVPATMLSHMLVSQLFGMESGMHHAANVLFHLLAAVLLLMFLQRATGALLPSAFVALVFAVHPLHVESVAWVAERKDVLSGFFFFLALYGYVRYAERPSPVRYLLVLVPFGMGLMSKPMLVTFPFLLLLLDVWPLHRVQWPRVVLEKLPLVLLSAGESAGTYWVQKVTGSVLTVPLFYRVSNALTSYVVYIDQAFWPTHLAVFYPYPHVIVRRTVWLCLAGLVAISAAVTAVWRTRPYLAVGWFWFLGMLVPVVGFVQTGFQARADRYMYLPMVGLLVMLTWGGVDLGRRWPKTKPLLMAAAGLSVVLCTAVAWRQTTYWQNSETLFVHALEVTEGNWLAQGLLGTYLTNVPERRGEAINHLETALRIRPDYPEAHNNLASCLSDAGLCDSAIPHFLVALRATPNDPVELTNLGLCLYKTGRYAEAVGPFQRAILQGSGHLGGRVPGVDHLVMVDHLDLGRALSNIPGREAEAIPQLEAVLKLNPNVVEAHHSLAEVLIRLGRAKYAIPHLEAEERIRPTPEISKQLADLRSQRK